MVKERSRSLREDGEGVSVVIGAMLLILITVVAAASLAVIVSEAQKKDMDRKSLESAIASEKIHILGVSPQRNSTDPGYIDSINLTLQNVNVDDARLVTIYVNNKPAFNYSLVGENGRTFDDWVNYNVTNRYDLEGSRSATFNLNFTKESSNFSYQWYPVQTNETLTIKVMTSYVNIFNTTITPPTPVFTIKTLTMFEDGVNKDYLVLDASDSTDESSIVGYNWTVFDAGKANGNWDDSANIASLNVSGKVISYYPNSSGPFKARLTVLNDRGLERSAENVTVPTSASFNPIRPEDLTFISVDLIRNESYTTGMNVTVYNRKVSNVSLTGLSVNGYNATNYTVKGIHYNQSAYYNVTGSNSAKLTINFTDPEHFVSPFVLNFADTITIDLFTALYHTFEKFIIPPTPIIKVDVQTQRLGAISRDYLVLDGSDSYSSGSITGWQWMISNGNTVIPLTGKIVHAYLPNSTCPYTVNLTVRDSANMSCTSAPVDIPADQNFNPVANIRKEPIVGNTISVKVSDLFNNPVAGRAIAFTPISGTVSITGAYASDTNGNGLASTTVAGSGIVRAYADNIWVDIAVP